MLPTLLLPFIQGNKLRLPLSSCPSTLSFSLAWFSCGLVAPDFHFTNPAEVINRLTQACGGQPVDSICFLDVGGPDNTIRLMKGLDLSLWALNDRQDKTGVQNFMMQVVLSSSTCALSCRLLFSFL